MVHEARSISEHIDCLARMTGAPGSFVAQVRALFTAKGIPLDADAAPFIPALEEAFRREENIRAGSSHARQQIAKLRENFRRVGQAYVEQLSHLRRPRPGQPDPPRRDGRPRRDDVVRVTISGDHRTLVTRTVREELPLVPGPKERQ